MQGTTCLAIADREVRRNIDTLVANTSEKSTRIGYMFWYYIPKGYTDRDVADMAFRQSGLPEEYRFPDIRAVDAYRRASKSIEGRTDLADQNKVQLLVRDVWHNKDEVVRHLVVEMKDVSGHRLHYDAKAAMLRFDRNHEMVDTEVYNTEPYVVDAVHAFEQNYPLYLTTYDSAAKRRVALNVLKDLTAAPLKESGGVYLVPRTHEELLFQLAAFIRGLPGCNEYKMPVEDTAEARDVVRDIVTNNAQAALSELRAALQADDIPDERVQDLLARARQIRKEVDVYQGILKESIGSLETDVELLEVQMMTLIDRL